MARLGPACEKYGFIPQTPEFGNCILQLQNQEIGAVGAAAGFMGANAQMQQNMRR